MSQKIIVPTLSVEQLEAGLSTLRESGRDRGAFWDDHVLAFRQTAVDAIRETSHALLSPTISRGWRGVLEEQLDELERCVELADRYISGRQAPLRSERSRLH